MNIQANVRKPYCLLFPMKLQL